MSELHTGRDISESAANEQSAPQFDVLNLLLDSRLVKYGEALAAKAASLPKQVEGAIVGAATAAESMIGGTARTAVEIATGAVAGSAAAKELGEAAAIAGAAVSGAAAGVGGEHPKDGTADPPTVRHVIIDGHEITYVITPETPKAVLTPEQIHEMIVKSKPMENIYNPPTNTGPALTVTK